MSWTDIKNISVGRSVGILIFLCGVAVILFSYFKESFFLILFGLQLIILSIGLVYKRFLSLTIVMTTVVITLFAVEFFLKILERESVTKIKSIATTQSSNVTAYTGGDYSKDYFIRTDIGSQAKPGMHSSIKSSDDGVVIYNANYTIGDDGFRVTQNNNKLAGKKVNFFGCSFMFGEGLNDNQTLPFFFAQQGHFLVKNFGFHGYGPQHALAILTSKRDTSGDINFYLTSPWHSDRAACIPNYVAGSPRYVLENGLVKQHGYCGDGIEKTVSKSKIYSLINNVVAKTEQTEQLELYIALIEKMNSLSKEKGQDFLVGYIKADQNWFTGLDNNESILKKLKDRGIRVIDMTLANTYEELGQEYYIHKLDKHPSGKANEARAKILLESMH